MALALPEYRKISVVGFPPGMGAMMKLPLDAITIKKRRREDYGDIAGLAASIQKYGLLHPVVVDFEGTLVAGERRLRAVSTLGWETIECRDIGELSEAEAREIELEENLRRKDLTPYEQSRTLVKLAETAREVAREQAEFRAESTRNSVGRPKQAGSLRDVAERIGVPEPTIRAAQRHVEAAEKYPELQAREIPQKVAVEVAKTLDVLPETEREERREIIRTAGPAALTLAAGETFPTGKLSDEQKAFYAIGEQVMKLAKWKGTDPLVVADVPPPEAVHPFVVEVGKVLDWVMRVHAAVKAREEKPSLRAVK